MRLLIVDDHQIVIDGIKLIIDSVDDIHFVGKANSGAEALAFLKKVKIDIVLMDINMPGMNGIECCGIIRRDYPETKVLMLSMLKEISMVQMAKKEGANGYLLKNSGKDEVINSIRQVYVGEDVFDEKILNGPRNFKEPSENNEINRPLLKISRREKQVLNLIASELTTNEIAHKLFISFGTVETHRRNLLLKMDVRNTAGLIRKAIKFNLIE